MARAAWACWFGPGSPLNAAGPVPGLQTIQRAELCAALQAACRRGGPLLIVTDSRYVARGIAALRVRCGAPDALHGDLWARLWAAGGGTVIMACACAGKAAAQAN